VLEVVVGADLLDQLVVDAEEGDEDADDLEGLGAEPGSVALRVLGEAHLGGVVQAGLVLPCPVGLLVLHVAVEGLGWAPLGQGALLGGRAREWRGSRHQHLEAHCLGGGHDADRDVSQAGGVVAEVDAEGPVDVVDDLPSHQQAELQCLDVEVEVAPAKDLLGAARLERGLAPGTGIWQFPSRLVLLPVPGGPCSTQGCPHTPGGLSRHQPPRVKQRGLQGAVGDILEEAGGAQLQVPQGLGDVAPSTHHLGKRAETARAVPATPRSSSCLSPCTLLAPCTPPAPLCIPSVATHPFDTMPPPIHYVPS